MLSKYSVKKPYTIVVSVILVILLGVISFTRMTADLLPSIDLPYVIVMTTYPGASPEKVEMSVTKPLEQSLATTTGVENVTSISNENSSVIMLEFSQSVNMDSVMIEMSGYVDLVKANFDEGVGTPMLMKLNPDMLPVMTVSIDADDMDIKELSKYVEQEIIPEFEKIEGVASVTSTGIVEQQVSVKLQKDKIDEINKKVLASVDKQLAEAQNQLDTAKAQIESGKNTLAEEGTSKTEELAEGTVALEDGKTQIDNALSTMASTKTDLQQKREELVKQKEMLEKLIAVQEENNLEVIQQEKDALKQFNDGIAAIDNAITQIDTEQPGLESKLAELKENEKLLEVGKITLSQELAKASAALAANEAELAKATEEFNAKREEAYKNAGVGDVITSDTISKILMAENFSMPAGYIEESGEKYLVKVGDTISSIEEMENLVLFNIDVEGVGEIKLKDVAEVSMVDNSSEMYAKINGNDGIVLSFQKQSTSATAEVSKSINKTISKLIGDKEGLHITSLQDQGVYIDIVVDSVLNNLILGGILAVIILFVFLRNIKPTIIVAFSIPISLMFALVLMYFSGVTMNIISLSGLALGVGMLVDNSIVVIENIYRLRNEGVPSATAAVKGAKQVAGAIFASTLTTVCVFLPIVFTEGLSRQLFTDMGLTIGYSLIASLIVALTLVPSMAATVLKNNVEKEHKFFNKIVVVYEKILRAVLKHKSVILIFSVLVLGLSAYYCVKQGTTLIPEMDSTQISITMEMDNEATTEELREMSNVVIGKIAELDDVQTVGSMQSSNSAMSLLSGGNSKAISIYVILKDDKKHSSIEVGDLIAEKTADLNCDLSISTSNMDMSALGGSGISIDIKGDDLDTLKTIAKDVGDILRNTKGTDEVSDGLEESSTETRVIVDKNKAMKYNLTVAQVYQAIAATLSNETKSTTLTMESNDYPVVIVKADGDAITRENLKDYKITVTENNEEKEISLSEIASISEEEGLTAINRDNSVRAMQVTASIDSAHNVGLVSEDVEKKLAEYKLPEGYTIDMGGETEAIVEAFTDLIKMISLAIVFIYLIMVAQFQSLLSPFIVLFTIPLAFTGGFIGLLISGFELSMISMLGFLVLSGVVVNNGIVFVDYVNQLRLEGMDKKEALVAAGKTRLRPILMTALTTILGLSTLAMGIGMGADMVQPMAVVTIGGLTYATILTLFVVPSMYDILHRRELKPIEIDEELLNV